MPCIAPPMLTRAGAGLSTTTNLAGVATFAGLIPVDATNAGHMTTSPHATSPRASAPPHLAIVLFSLAMGGFAIGTTEFASMSLLPFFAADLGIDEPTAGHAISAYALGVVLGAPLIAVLGARFARRTQLLALMAVFALGNALTALAPGFGWMIAAPIPVGIAAWCLFRHRRAGRSLTRSAAPPLAGDRPGHARPDHCHDHRRAPGQSDRPGGRLARELGLRVGAGVAHRSLLCALFAPRDQAGRSDPLRELGALRNGRIWITLAIGAIGFGGMFAVYTISRRR